MNLLEMLQYRQQPNQQGDLGGLFQYLQQGAQTPQLPQITTAETMNQGSGKSKGNGESSGIIGDVIKKLL